MRSPTNLVTVAKIVIGSGIFLATSSWAVYQFAYARPTRAEVRGIVETHSAEPHAKTTQLLEKHDERIRAQREQLIRIEAQTSVTSDTVKEIKEDVKTLTRQLRK